MSSQPLVLVLAQNEEKQFDMLKGTPHVIGNKPEAFTEAAQEAGVILHWSGPREVLRSVFLMSPKLRWVHSRAAGLDNLLFPELVESEIPLTNGSGVFSDSLGEFALGVMLYFAKNFRRLLRNQEAGRWEQFDVDEIAGQTLGMVGYGSIGHAVASRAHAMGMHVHAWDRRYNAATKDTVVEQFYDADDMATMLGRADFVVTCMPLTPETRHMVSDVQFGAMKRSAIFINIGRGPVVEQAALVRALAERKIAGAGLDVFETEPLPDGDPIFKFENVLISPHCADHTRQWLDNAMRFFLEQYGRFKSGERLQNVVNKKLGY
jgi:phosphoglycerate dehydrogenase-like enzyme